MKIEKGANIAVVVNRSWANLWGVRVFLRQNETPEREVRGDDSHLVFAKLLDSEDPNGLWVELNTERQKKDPTVKLASFFIPWSQVLTIVVTEEFSPAIREEIRKIGFAGWPTGARKNEGEGPMTVWVELQNGTKKIYKNVNRIVERSGNLEIRSGTGLADNLLIVYEKSEIKNLGNSTTLPHRLLKRFDE
jgi:hypothetical protein